MIWVVHNESQASIGVLPIVSSRMVLVRHTAVIRGISFEEGASV